MEGIPASATIVSAIVGAVFGAFATNIVRAHLEHLKEDRNTKRELVGELSSFTHEYVAALMLLHLARHSEPNNEWGAESRKCLSKVTELDGQVMHLDIRIRQAFRAAGRLIEMPWRPLLPLRSHERKSLRIRAGCHKLFNRFKESKRFILQRQCPSFKEVDFAFAWIASKASEITEYAAEEAGIDLYERGGVAFIGFTRATAEKTKRQLSYDDEAPPWVFDVRFEFRDKQNDTSAQEKLAESLAQKVGNMRCPEHEQPLHILAKGRSDKFALEISGCCKEFVDAVHTTIPGPSSV